MRWRQTKKEKKSERYSVIRKGFLFFPKTVHYQTRWLEYAEWEAEWWPATYGDSYGWHSTRWLN